MLTYRRIGLKDESRACRSKRIYKSFEIH